jgi:hypothetical protein
MGGVGYTSGKPTEVFMKLMFSLLALAAFSSSAHAERVQIRLDQNVRSEDRILLRQELARAGYDSRDYQLRSVSVVAEGAGQINLVIGNELIDSKRLQKDGYPVARGFRVDLTARRVRNMNGPWQLHFGANANMKVRKLVIEIDYLGGGFPGNPREIVYNVRLESLGNGILNGLWEAPRGERIVDMRLLRQHSNDSCVLGRSYNYSSYEATVARGCRATFEIVTVRERF